MAAFSALKADGLPNISYERIAAEANVSRQVVRYHFAKPDDLMVELCDYLAATYRDALVENALDLAGPVRIEMFLDFYFGLCAGQPKPDDDQVYDALMSRAASSASIRQSLGNQYGLLGQVLSHEFQVAYPTLSQQKANQLSYIFVSLMYGHWKMVASLGFGAHHNVVAREGMARLIRAVVEDGEKTTNEVAIWARD